MSMTRLCLQGIETPKQVVHLWWWSQLMIHYLGYSPHEHSEEASDWQLARSNSKFSFSTTGLTCVPVNSDLPIVPPGSPFTQQKQKDAWSIQCQQDNRRIGRTWVRQGGRWQSQWAKAGELRARCCRDLGFCMGDLETVQRLEQRTVMIWPRTETTFKNYFLFWFLKIGVWLF